MFWPFESKAKAGLFALVLAIAPFEAWAQSLPGSDAQTAFDAGDYARALDHFIAGGAEGRCRCKLPRWLIRDRASPDQPIRWRHGDF